MVQDYQRPMGSNNHRKRSECRVLQHSRAEPTARVQLLNARQFGNKPRDSGDVAQKSNRDLSIKRGRSDFTFICSAQAIKRQKTSMRWSLGQQTHDQRTFSHGEPCNCPEHTSKRGLDDCDRSQRCILPCSNQLSPTEISSVQMEGDSVQIQMPSIWNHISSSNIYQNNEIGAFSPQTERNSVGGIHRRSIDNVQKQRSELLSNVSSSGTSDKIGMDNQLDKIKVNSAAVTEILGNDCKLLQYDL